MARITKPLNATQIEKAKPKDREYNLADGQGLMLRIKPNGSKAWYFNYYHPHTKKRKAISFGLYPELTLALARNQRDKARALIQADIARFELLTFS